VDGEGKGSVEKKVKFVFNLMPINTTGVMLVFFRGVKEKKVTNVMMRAALRKNRNPWLRLHGEEWRRRQERKKIVWWGKPLHNW